MSLSFNNVSSYLIALKYLGIGLAAVSSIWGTVSVLTVTTADGRKRLTRAGTISILLTITGLLISVLSEDFQRKQAANSQAAQISAEAKRTNEIIIAGQPLRSLNITWSFQGVPTDLLKILSDGNNASQKYIDDQQGERSASQNSAAFRENMLYPFLSSLCRTFAHDTKPNGKNDVVTLVTLDDDLNSVLPFGHLDEPKPWGRLLPQDEKKYGPPSLEIGEIGYFGNSALARWPSLTVNDAKVTIEWQLDPETFAKSINRQNQTIIPTAQAPKTLLVAVLFDIEDFPFSTANFALADDPNFWKFPDYPDRRNDNFRGKIPFPSKDFTSTIQIIPNNSSVITYNYILNQIYETLFRDSYEEANSNLRCLVFEFKLQS